MLSLSSSGGRRTRVLLFVAATAFLFFLVAIPFGSKFLTINSSPSMPMGLYVKTGETYHIGDIVWVKRLSPNDPVNRLKYLLGRGTDVSLINGEILAYGLSWGHVLVPYNTTQDQWSFKERANWFIWSPHLRSNDSRYFGYVPESKFYGTYAPLLVFGASNVLFR